MQIDGVAFTVAAHKIGAGVWHFLRQSLSIILRFPPLRYSQDRCETALDVFFGGCPTRNADPHSGAPVPLSPAAPAGPLLLHASNDATSFLGVAKAHEYLVEHDLIENFESSLLETVSENASPAAVSLDQRPESFAPQ